MARIDSTPQKSPVERGVVFAVGPNEDRRLISDVCDLRVRGGSATAVEVSRAEGAALRSLYAAGVRPVAFVVTYAGADVLPLLYSGHAYTTGDAIIKQPTPDSWTSVPDGAFDAYVEVSRVEGGVAADGVVAGTDQPEDGLVDPDSADEPPDIDDDAAIA